MLIWITLTEIALTVVLCLVVEKQHREITKLRATLRKRDETITRQAAQLDRAIIEGGLRAFRFAAEHDPRERLAANARE